MNFSLYIAKRYLFSKSSTNAINIITVIATFGVIVGATALFVILSGFSGLRTFSFSLLDVSDPDVKITPVTGKTFFVTPEIQEKLNTNTAVACYSKIVEERVFLKHKDKNHLEMINILYLLERSDLLKNITYNMIQKSINEHNNFRILRQLLEEELARAKTAYIYDNYFFRIQKTKI